MRVKSILIWALLLVSFILSGCKSEKEIQNLPLATWVNGEISSDGVDWYTFSTEKPGEYVVQLILSSDNCTRISLYNSDQETRLIGWLTCLGGEENKAEIRYNLEPGQFFLKIEGNPGVSYRLRVNYFSENNP